MSAIRRIMTVFLTVSALVACQEDTGSVESDGSVPDILAEQRIACEKDGGSFGKSANGITFVCYRQMSDANQPCTSASDCDGLCLARSRTCSPIEPFFGCHEVISSGGVQLTRCIE